MRVWPLTWTSWPEAPLRRALLPDGVGDVFAADAGLPQAASTNAVTAMSGRKRFMSESPFTAREAPQSARAVRLSAPDKPQTRVRPQLQLQQRPARAAA